MPRTFSVRLSKEQKFALITGLLIVLLLLINRRPAQASKKRNRPLQLDDFTVTNTGLANVPDAASRANIERAIKVFFQPLEGFIGRDLVINSGYRSEAVNEAVKGVKTSKHLVGLGFDFEVFGESGSWIISKIKQAGLWNMVDYYKIYDTHLHIELNGY